MAIAMALTVFAGFGPTFYLRGFIHQPTVTGALTLSPLAIFHGTSAPFLRSDPTMKTGVMEPPGSFQLENPTTTGTTLATPLTASALSRTLLSRSDMSSKLLAPLVTIHRSAAAWSINRRHHAAEAEIEAHLHHHQHDGEHDADQGRGKAQPVLKEIPRCERPNERQICNAPSDGVLFI